MTARAHVVRRTLPATLIGRWRTQGYGAVVVTTTLLTLVSRLLYLGHLPLWRDEAFTGVVARRSWTAMLDAVRGDSAPPLSYLLTHAVTTASSPAWTLRLVPALAGTGAVPIAAALGRRLAGDRAGGFTALTVAVLPAYVLSARDARMYALATTLVMAAALTLWRAVESPTRARLAVHAACVAVAVHTQYLAVLGVSVGLLAVLAVRPGRGPWLRSALATSAGVLTLLPWLIAARGQFSHASQTFWVKPVGPASLLGVLTEFFCGPPIDRGLPGRTLVQVIQGVAIGGGSLTGFAVLFTVHRASVRERRALAYLTGSGLGAIVLLIVVSLRRPVLDARYASVVWGVLAPVVGAGMARLRPRPLAAMALGTLAAASAALCLALVRPDVATIMSGVGKSLGRDGVVVLASPGDYLPVLYYGDPGVGPRTHIIAGTVAWYWGVAAFLPGAVEPRIARVGGPIDVVGDPQEPPPPLPSGFRLTSRRCAPAAPGVCLSTYAAVHPER